MTLAYQSSAEPRSSGLKLEASISARNWYLRKLTVVSVRLLQNTGIEIIHPRDPIAFAHFSRRPIVRSTDDSKELHLPDNSQVVEGILIVF